MFETPLSSKNLAGPHSLGAFGDRTKTKRHKTNIRLSTPPYDGECFMSDLVTNMTDDVWINTGEI